VIPFLGWRENDKDFHKAAFVGGIIRSVDLPSYAE
jgi:hypothetical protein